mgnify:CR=1 FL=1
MDDERPFGVVRTGRWLAWGFNHGTVIRPSWLAHAIVTVWNWVSCHTMGHDWFPHIDWDRSKNEPRASETQEFCPNCCAERTRP